MADSVKLSSSAVKTLFGVEQTSNPNASKRPDDIGFISRYSTNELKRTIKENYVEPTTKGNGSAPQGIIPYLTSIHKSSGNKISELKKMKALAPEIDQSKILVSSSIMSPNDLQDGEFIFSFNDSSGIAGDEELSKELAELYSEYFNKTLKLGLKAYDWLGEIQYTHGSKSLLILPQASQQALKDRTVADAHESNKRFFGMLPGLTSFDNYYSDIPNDDYFWSGMNNASWGNILSDSKEMKEFIHNEGIPSLESLGIHTVTTRYNREEDVNALAKEDLILGMEDMIVNLRTKLQEGDVLKVSENPELLRFGSAKKFVNKQAERDKLKNKYHPKYVRETMLQIETNPEGYEHFGRPTLIEIPTEAVIPVHVPGTPSEHIGYFILLDQHGQCLSICNSGLDYSSDCGVSNDAAYEAIFGTNCCSRKMNKGQVHAAGNIIFQRMFDNYLRERVKGVSDRGDLEISRVNAISTVMFHRLLEQKKTTMVYVTPTLLHYLAFEYRDDGTGQAKTEDIQFLLSLRSYFTVAQVIAAANDAVEHRKVEFTLDDKNANVEEIMALLGNIFDSKRKFTNSIDPNDIVRDIYSNSLTIVPKNLPGLSSLDVDISSNSGGSTQASTDLLDQITSLAVSQLDVPPSALSQLGEPEFSRSLATYNLFFAKKIARYQRIFCALMKEFIVVYSDFDITFKHAILKKLEAHGKRQARINELRNRPRMRAGEQQPSKQGRVRTATKRKINKLKNDNPNKYSVRNNELLNKIISGIEISLASPNISVDKTQFEELNQFMSNLDAVAGHIFLPELIPAEDDVARNTIEVVKAHWKKSQMMRFIEQVGNFNMVEFPNMEDFEPTDVVDFIQELHNTAKSLKSHREHLGDGDVDGGGFGDDSGYGSDDEYGDDYGDDGMDDSMDEDMSSEEGVSDDSMDESSGEEETSSSNEEEQSDSVATMYVSLLKKKK